MDNSKPMKNEALASQDILRSIEKGGAQLPRPQSIMALAYPPNLTWNSSVANGADRGAESSGFAGWSAQQTHFTDGKQYFGGLPVLPKVIPRNEDTTRETLFPTGHRHATVEHGAIVGRPLPLRGFNVNDNLAPTLASTNSIVDPAFLDFYRPATNTTLKRSHSVMLEGNEGEDTRSLAGGRPMLIPPYAARPNSQQEHALPQAPKHKPAPIFIDLTSPSPSPKPPARETYLQRLPAELRNRIYHDVGLKSARLDMVSTPEPALTLAIPDLRDELHSIIFSENKLRVSVYTKIRKHTPEPRGPLDLAPKTLPAAGIIAVPKTHWMWRVSPRFVNIKHICFRVRQQDDGEGLCDFFVNMRLDAKGKLVVRSRLDVFSQGLRQRMRPVGDLARAVLRSVSEREGFQGLSWEDAQKVAACFVSVEDAEARIARKYRKVTLV